jgi:hypothetical protein
MSLQEFPDFDAAVRAPLELATEELSQEFEGSTTASGCRPSSTSRLVSSAAARSLPSCTCSPSASPASGFGRTRTTEGRLAKPTTEVLFVSLTGGGRAQIAAALLARRAGGAVQVHTAGCDFGA